MIRSLESMWVSWLDSSRWRRFSKRGAGARFFRSRAFRKMDMLRRFAVSYYHTRLTPQLFQDVSAFCTFIGHAKSGGTLIGSLLDAHPDVILADETDVLGYMTAGFSRDQIYHLLLKGSRREALKGRVTARRLEPYSFAVPGQWQSRYKKLRVIGHSRAGPTTRKLSHDPALLDELREVMAGVQLKVIHVIRNPYDPIGLMMVRGERSFENAVDHYFNYCNILTALHERLDSASLWTVRYEEFIRRPRAHLIGVCEFLGVQASDDYLDACTGILYKSPELNRQMIDWKAQWIETVNSKIDHYGFLQGYSYDD